VAAARYGLSVDYVQKVVAAALGGETVTTTVEGRERYGVNVRYPRGLRDDPEVIASQVLVPTMGGAMVPLGQIASLRVTMGPPSINTENAQPVAYVYVDLQDRDLGGYVAEASLKVAAQVKMPPGYHIEWSSQFEYLQRAEAKLKVVVPATLVVIVVLLFLNFGRLTETFIVMLSVPFALVGGAWLMWWLGYNMSVAVAVGFIALAGVAAETGVLMLIYLDQALAEIGQQRLAEGVALSRADYAERS
jgi:Cu(I)/Ag(I) efflux system membrane protein CusA/SilA